MNNNPTPEPIEDEIDENPSEPEYGIIDVDDYEIPVVEEDTDARFPCFIAGSTLIVRLDYVDELQIPLRFSYKQIQKLRAEVDPDADELEQLVFLLGLVAGADGENLGKEKAAALLDTLTNIDLADSIAIGMLFFRAWKQRTRVTLGKLRGSSRR